MNTAAQVTTLPSQGRSIARSSHWGQFCPPRGIWQCQETFLVVATGSDTAGIQWIEAKVLLNTMQCTE